MSTIKIDSKKAREFQLEDSDVICLQAICRDTELIKAKMIRVGIIGGAGYTAGELVRLLLNHPEAEIKFINSSSNAGYEDASIHGGLIGETELIFTVKLPLDSVDVLFLCSAHGDSKKFLEKNTPKNH